MATVEQICATSFGVLDLREASVRMMEIFAEAFKLHGEDWQLFAMRVNEGLRSLPDEDREAINAALQSILEFELQTNKKQQSN